MVTRQIKYEWDYLYGSLDVVSRQAHFCQFPSINLEWDHVCLKEFSLTDEEAVHMLIRDQAGFHLRDGDPRLTARVRIVDLPPYNPELNPCEQLWDIVKDDIGNQVLDSIEALREAMLPTLPRYSNDAAAVLRLIGREWIVGKQYKFLLDPSGRSVVGKKTPMTSCQRIYIKRCGLIPWRAMSNRQASAMIEGLYDKYKMSLGEGL